jgi:hypothetical protein
VRKNKFRAKKITVVSALCFSVLYTNTAFAVWPVTEEVLTPYLMGASPQSMGNGIIETLVSMNDKLAQATITTNENQKNAVVSNASQAIQEQRMKNILNRMLAPVKKSRAQVVVVQQDRIQAQRKRLYLKTALRCLHKQIPE